jgi:outer membrane receptor protein involved in Fe transport
MSLRLSALAVVAMPMVVRSQQPAPRDSAAATHQHGDSLTRRVFELAPVTITTTPSRRDEPTSTVRVSRRVLQRTPGTDAYDLLRQTAGVEVHEQGQGPGFASDASVRGFSSDHSTDLALWVDGVPNNEPVNGHAEGYNDWNLLFPQAIEDVDVLKGPTSALYGNFAMAGVVNVRTVERMRGVSVWLDPGSYGRAEGVVLGGFDHDTTAGVFGLRGVREDGWRPHSDYRLGQGHARLIHRLTPSTTLDAGVELYATGWNSPGYLTESHYTAGAYNIVANPTDGGFKRRAQERISLRVLASSSLLWRTTLYATQGRWQLYLTIPPAGSANEGSGGQIEQEDQRYGLGLTSALSWALPRAEITVGTEGRWDHAGFQNWVTTNRTRVDTGQTVVAARQASAALFVQATEDVTRHLRVTLGGRLDGQDTQSAPSGGAATSHAKAVFSPKLGALYHLTIPVDFYANVSRGFRQTDGVITDPTLPFITTWAYETGVKLDTRAVSGSIALFRMDVSNEQTFNPALNTVTSGGASRRQGVELEFAGRVTPALSLTTDWTFNDARYRQTVASNSTPLNGLRVFNTAQYVGIVTLELAPARAHWQLRAGSDVVGPYSPFDMPGVVRPAYGLVQLSGSIERKQTLVELGVRNVFNTAYRELEAGGFVSPGQPRSVYGKLRYAL